MGGQVRLALACVLAGVAGRGRGCVLQWGTAPRMGCIDRYIFRTTFAAFLVVFVSLTAVIWLTQALRQIDLLTDQGQTILVFIGITMLIIPFLMLVTAPISLLIAGAHVLNKLSSDSEIIVINAAGMSPWALFRSFLAVATLISLMTAAISAYVAPKGLRMLRDSITEVRANVVTRIAQPGSFTALGSGVTIHIRERRPNGQLLGIFLDDRRDPAERVTILADVGEVLDNESGTFLILQNGVVQRLEANQPDPSMVGFDRYAFDLSRFSNAAQSIEYSIHEQFLWQLFAKAPNDKKQNLERNNAQIEIYDRLTAPIYPIAFMVVAYVFLGVPRTNRQSRTISMVSTIVAVAALRLSGFVSNSIGALFPLILPIQMAGLCIVIALGLFAIKRSLVIEPPAWVMNFFAALSKRFSFRFATQ